MTPKIIVKDRFTDGEIDLSMSDLDNVPVKEIAQLRKVYSLDLSNNRLTTLPKTFCTLTHITKLDLSKNELQSLPEDFGKLVKLKYLDLYHNQLQHLPLSFSKLKALKWLDLKDNPLVPTVAKIAGPCLDTKQCQSCARDVVNFFIQFEAQVNADLEMRNKNRQKQLEINQQKRKLEEKKEKKKEKQKQKLETAKVQNDLVKNKAKKDKKLSKLVEEDKSSKNNFLPKLFGILFLTFVILSVVASVKISFKEILELMYNTFLEKFHLAIELVGNNLGT